MLTNSVVRANRSEKITRHETSSLMNQLVKGMLTVGARLSPNDRTRRLGSRSVNSNTLTKKSQLPDSNQNQNSTTKPFRWTPCRIVASTLENGPCTGHTAEWREFALQKNLHTTLLASPK